MAMDDAPAALTLHDGSCCKCGATEPLIRISDFGKALCEGCYPEFVRRRVEATVRRFRMIPKGAHVALGVSGGADSGTLLETLAETRKRLNFTLTAVHVDMGLGDYSAESLAVCEAQAQAVGVRMVVERVEDYGVDVREAGRWPTCAVCGAVRRAILPRVTARIRAGVLATGHTLDDQLQYMLKNILSGHPVSPAPVLPATAGLPLKVKPLIQIPDAATKTYARLRGLAVVASSCPQFDRETHGLKEVFAVLERHAPMGRLQFWHVLRKVMRPTKEEAAGQGERPCPRCGEWTRMPLCAICRLRDAQRASFDAQEDAL